MARKSFKRTVNGKSVLEACNVDGYPKHNFHHTNIQEHIYPVFPLSFGDDHWRKGGFRKRVCSDTFAVEYVQKGVFIFQQNNVTLRIQPGEIFLVHLDANCSMRTETESAEKLTVIMSGALLRPMLETLGLTQVNMIVPAEPRRIDGYFARLEKLRTQDNRDNRLDACLACYSLLIELAENITILRRPPELRQALEYINSHLSQPIDLDELVRFCHSSKATLHRQFRKYMQVSPIQYCLDQKMTHARYLLENHFISIKEVVQKLNYSSPQYFSAEFKKKYGVSPKHFKHVRSMPPETGDLPTQ